MSEQTYRFSGPMPGRKVSRNKGIMRKYREQKRAEAEARHKAYESRVVEVEIQEPLPPEPIRENTIWVGKIKPLI